MAFELVHTLVDESFRPKKFSSGDEAYFRVDERGNFSVRFPGRLHRSPRATFVYRHANAVTEVEGSHGAPPHGGFVSENKVIPLTLRIFMPDGREFTGDEITLSELQKHRDLRGNPSGFWSYSLTGESEHLIVGDGEAIVNPRCTVIVNLTETVLSQSAPMLIDHAVVTHSSLSFQFDLFRLGTFVATISQPQQHEPWEGLMRLLDPDGVEVARTESTRLSFEVGLQALDKSRDSQHRVRNWKLELVPESGEIAGEPRVSATVIGSGRTKTHTLARRIDRLLGPHGENISVFGKNKDGQALLMLKINAGETEESLDMYHVLDLFGQDGGAYVLVQHPEVVPLDFAPDLLNLEVDGFKVNTIDIDIGPGIILGDSTATIRLVAKTSGSLKFKVGSAVLAEGRPRDDELVLEVGTKIDSNGESHIVASFPENVIDIDPAIDDPFVLGALLVTLGVVGPLGAIALATALIGSTEIFEEIATLFFDLLPRELSKSSIAPMILMTILGAHVSHLPIRFEDDDILFEHIAPVEPEPKETPGYQGAIGRSIVFQTSLGVTFSPPLLGDTWRADNLQQKIDHIVVVMMENRSYDHVLGYRSQIGDDSDGLTTEMIEAIREAEGGPFNIRKLRDAGFPKNEVGRMTKLPKGVGHAVSDVKQQLSLHTPRPDGRTINSPKGFVDNFSPKLHGDSKGVVPDDVLGYYDNEDLPFFAFLAEHYSYCDRYFCSHPGPTMPNRMYSLTGDLQRDRYGFPVLDNNDSDNFLLSRAPTIYDYLARKGISFRVYESEPSVTMLRMFARYATDNINIVPFDRLAADVARGDLPAFTAIEPQMHFAPENDDHPPADMHLGQIFLMNVYNTLISNPRLWQRTLLIITYDEHGGLYDHVVPPVADVLTPQLGPIIASPVFRDQTPQALLIPYGLRVPTFVVSPWTTPGKGPSLTLDHCSILKSVLARFLGTDRPFLSDRVSVSHSFEAFLTEAAPRLNVPPFNEKLLPRLRLLARRAPNRSSQVVTKPLFRKDMRDGPVDYHDLTGRWARQLGR